MNRKIVRVSNKKIQHVFVIFGMVAHKLKLNLVIICTLLVKSMCSSGIKYNNSGHYFILYV